MRQPLATRNPVRAWVVLAAVFAAGGAAMASEKDPDPFGELGLMRANQAFRIAEKAVSHDEVGARVMLLARGLAAMNYQPRTEQTIEGALRAFDDLIASGAEDEAAIVARYFQARIWQMHKEPADPRKARALYAALAVRHPDHPLAQYAWVKIGTMELYLDRKPEADARIRKVEGYLPKLTDPAVRRSLRHVLGQACQVLVDDPARALEHYEAALADGLAKDNLLADVLLRAAECARRVGRTEQARRYLTAYIERYPRSHATQVAHEILLSLP